MPKKGWKELDSKAAEEAERYENPIPSRLFIMEIMEQQGTPVTHPKLCRLLGVTEETQQQALGFRLKAMIRDGQLLQTRKGAYALLSKMDLVHGKIQGNRDGYGFLLPDDGSEDYYLSWREMRKVFNGDRAVIREIGVDRRGRREGQIVEVIERNTTQLVGRFYTEDGQGFVVPESARITHEIAIKPGAMLPTHGQYVLVELLEQPGRRTQPVGLVKEILGERQDAGMEVEVALRTHQIPHLWPDDLSRQAAAFGADVTRQDKLHRVDLRDQPLVTIDGEDARDFDDAVFCEKRARGGWRLFVAIADVSHYVSVGTPLDREAQNRGTSVYFPGHVIPMLPEVLSNGLCSLNPHVDRLAMVCEMTISARGRISGYRFYEGLIRSHARLTYNEVWKMLSEPESAEGSALRSQHRALVAHIDTLYGLYHQLQQVRQKRGTIEFETVETRIVFGRDRKIEKIVPTHRNDAHKIIEECMLAANVCAARFLQKQNMPALYRVHEGPTDEKRLTLNQFLATLGLALPAGKLTPAHFQTVLEATKTRPDFQLIQTVLLRSMSQAVYTDENSGHFGLSFAAYTHFTSPIRRYPDLLVHRAIRHVIRSGIETDQVVRTDAPKLEKKAIYPYEKSDMAGLGEHCSATERRADEATRDAMDWLKCEHMQQHIGKTFRGVITSVTGFGVFVALDDIFVEGLVHVTSLPDDYYHFDPVRHQLVGERFGKRYRLGDALEIRVTSVNLDDQKIDFELTEGAAKRRPSSDRTAKKNKAGPSRANGVPPSVAKSRAAKKKLIEAANNRSKREKNKKGSKSKTTKRKKRE